MYVKSRMLIGSITLTAIRVFEKINKAADLMLVKGQLSTELLAANNAKEKEREERNNAPNKVVQKYGEIYGYQARKQIEEDEREEALVINMREKRLRDPWKKRYKMIIKKFPKLYENIRTEGRFKRAGTNLELGLD